jgi:hypothetical protein
MKIKILLILLFISIPLIAYLQVGINTTGNPPNSSAGLDVDFTNKGFLLPRMTTVQRDAIQNPAIGLQIYNTSTNCIQCYMPLAGWKDIQCDCTLPSAAFTVSQSPITGLPVTFTASQAGNTFSWAFTSGSPSSATTQTANTTWNAIGTYNVTLTVTNNQGCTATSSQQVTVACSNPDATFTVSPNPSAGSPVTLTASQSGNTYNWVITSGSPSTATTQTVNTTWNSLGTYTVTLTTTNAYGCTASSTQQVNVGPSCSPAGPWTFSNCGQTGRLGPSQSQCNSTYSTTSLNGLVTVTDGVQQWTVPSTGVYRITAAGAQGGDVASYTGGQGAIVRGDFNLTAGTILYIVVGQQGLTQTNNNCNGGGGGGGSFVYQTSPLTLRIAGGAGGGAYAYQNLFGLSANSTENGNTNSTSSGNPGTAGNGGQAGACGSTWPGAGGAGWLNAGGNTCTWSNNITQGGQSYPTWYGGLRNPSTTQGQQGQDGSFGGGGGAFHGGGGGGGYSGGGGGGSCTSTSAGGGGGSYNSGSNPAVLGNNTGHGYVVIQKICP